MRQHAADLGAAAPALDAGHEPRKSARRARPFGRPAFIEAAKVDKLHIQPANRFRLDEHLTLDLKRAIPSGLAAHGGVHRENEPAAPSGLTPGRGDRFHLAQKA